MLDLQEFLEPDEVRLWLDRCYYASIHTSIGRHGRTRAAFVMGSRGRYGLKPEVKQRKLASTAFKKRRKGTDTKKLDKLLEEMT